MQLMSCMLVGVTGFEPATSTSQTWRTPLVLESKSVPLPILMARQCNDQHGRDNAGPLCSCLNHACDKDVKVMVDLFSDERFRNPH